MNISKLYPECKDYLWGGEKLKTKYGKLGAVLSQGRLNLLFKG